MPNFLLPSTSIREAFFRIRIVQEHGRCQLWKWRGGPL